MNIRPIEVDDAERFVALSKKIDESGMMLFDTEERQTTPEQQRRAIEVINAKKTSTFFIAEDEQKLIGFIGVIGNELNRKQHSAYLALGVLEEYQGQGVATKLFNTVFEWAKQVGISRLELTVIQHNIKAFNLYKKMGFEVEGEKVHSLMIDGKPVNEYYLYKLL